MSSTSLPLFEARFDVAWPVASWCETHVVLAVSGGADSVAMLRAAVALKKCRDGDGRVFAAHLNHALRGDVADADADWLKALCDELNVPLEIGKSDVTAVARREGDGWEAAARETRYDFLRRTAEGFGARFVAVAHTADDQVETVLHRIIRGTGIAGLAGMRSVRPLSSSVALVRPMLALGRQDVLHYLAAIGQDFRIDATNDDLRFTRNRLRHELLPAIRRHINNHFDAAILRLAAHAAESQQLLEDSAAQLVSDCVALEFDEDKVTEGSRRVSTIRINCQDLGTLPNLLVREVCKTAWKEAGWPLQAMGFDEWQQLAVLLQHRGEFRPVCLPGGVRAHRKDQFLILRSA